MNIQQPAWTTYCVHRIKASAHACATWFIKILFAQLFLTSFSLPIILWWGLPLSLLTVVGNIIFNPFISCFLLLATLLFFCELLCIPTAALAWLLEQVTDIWLWCVGQGSSSALVALPKPPLFVLFAIAGAALWIMYTFAAKQHQGVVAFMLFLALLAGALRYTLVPSTMSCDVPYGSRNVVVVADDTGCCLFDTFGVLRTGTQSSSWVNFTLRPFLVTKLGRISCDRIVVMRPTRARLQAACEIAQLTHAQEVVVPEEACNASVRACMEQAPIACKAMPEKLLRKFCFNHDRQRTKLREIFGK